jgi:predicted enzyme related to lactoylglutathione lyase
MERAAGIGGVFFRSDDAEGLVAWYAEHLGITGDSDDAAWEQEAGPTVFAPFGSEHWNSPHLGPTGWGINFRVHDLDAMVDQLRAADIEVAVDEQAHPNGRFAQLHDPEGNPVQLWQPMS